jgi:PhnB protein
MITTATQLNPYICVSDAAAAIEFYKEAFGAVELYRLTDPASGVIGHAELKIGEALLMLADEFPDYGIRGPHAYGGTAVQLSLMVQDVDAVVERALDAGATLTRAVADQFYGDRHGVITDPFGHRWIVGSRIEDLSPDEMQRRWDALVRS